jgi:Holliday junction resolvase RusA-like endonuclease
MEELMSVQTITIPGVPMGKPRMTQRDKWHKRPETSRYWDWANAARLLAGQMPDPKDVERLDWVAYFEPPPSWSKKKREEAIGNLHRSKPDRDNIDKAVLDTLFKSDSAIAAGSIDKRWGVPARLEITITTK